MPGSGEVYNLGRASGLSAWEVYLRQSLILNPDIEPLSEREWLSETIGLGDSMLLKITKDNTDGPHSRDYVLPSKSLLGAPRTVIGSFFYGEGAANEDGWCTKVTDYGPEISNTKDKNPGNGTKTAHGIPSNIADVSETVQRRMMQYVKIQDAVILQDGVWSDSGTDSPAKTFVPDITKPPMLRITFRGKVNEDFYILLTGFVNRAIIKGEVGFDMGAVIPDDEGEATAFRPENGDFLGPTLYPWANKVVFTYPGVLTSLLRDVNNIVSDSNNIAFLPDPDSPKTEVKLSPIVSGLGVQVDDLSKKGQPGTITVSSRIQSSNANNYLHVDQSKYDTTDGSSKVPSTLKVSAAKPAQGVGITQPKTPGGDYLVGAKIAIDAGKGFKYLGISQSAPDDATQPATTLMPAYGEAGPGIAIGEPATPGGAFKVSSKVESLGAGEDYIKVDQLASTNPDATTTKLYPSKAVAGKGVGIDQPGVAGGEHVISAIVSSEGCGSKYMNITQGDDPARDASTTSTILTPSKITSGKGIAITQPKTSGGDIVLSSILQSQGKASNYIKVDQEAHDSGCGCGCGDGVDASATTTKLTPSQIIPTSNVSRIVVDQPATPGGDIKIGTKIAFHAHKGVSIYDDPANGVTHIGSVITIEGKGAKGMAIQQSSIEGKPSDEESRMDNAATHLILSELVVDERNRAYTDEEGNHWGDILTITYPSAPAGDIVFYINVDELIRRMMRKGPLRNFMDDLLGKIFKGGEVQADGHIRWPEGTEGIKIPLCDLNIYSDDGEGETFSDALRSRPGNTSNDLRMK